MAPVKKEYFMYIYIFVPILHFMYTVKIHEHV